MDFYKQRHEIDRLNRLQIEEAITGGLRLGGVLVALWIINAIVEKFF